MNLDTDSMTELPSLAQFMVSDVRVIRVRS